LDAEHEIKTMSERQLTSFDFPQLRPPRTGLLIAAGLVVLFGSHTPVWATGSLTVSPEQRNTAQAVASHGVPLSELAPDAPEQYTVKTGDTLWAISGLYLKSPWRWPELWGMNLQGISNPHLIYPGQVLVLDKSNGRAVLKVKTDTTSSAPSDIPTIKVSPATRHVSLNDASIPALNPRLIEPFLAQPVIVDVAAFEQAPRIVAGQDDRVLLSRGDRAYARSLYQDSKETPQLVVSAGKSRSWRAYRNATPLKDPVTGEILAYEAHYLGRTYLVRNESQEVPTKETPAVPATLDIIETKEEIRAGDRLIQDSERNLQTYVPHAPKIRLQARILSTYNNVLSYASTNQVVSLNKGSQDGLEPGHVLAILRDKSRIEDKTDPAKPNLDLPVERNGLLMIFQTFDRVSYALIVNSTDGVKLGDLVVNPR
jgi:LysM repeat protein